MEGTSRKPPSEEKAASVLDWRSKVTPEVRRWLVNMIIETSRRCVPISLPIFRRAQEKVAVQFEERIYNSATSQPDYLQQISSKMLALEIHFQNHSAVNRSASVLGARSQNPADPEDPSPQSCNCYMKVQKYKTEIAEIQISGPSSARNLKRSRTCPTSGWEGHYSKTCSKKNVKQFPSDEESHAVEVSRKPKRSPYNRYQYHN